MAAHRLITSNSLSRLETALFHAIREQKQGQPLRPVVVLCASGFLGHYLARELARIGTPHAGISFLSFNELAEALARPTLLRQKAQPLPEGGKELILRQLLLTLPPESYFRQVQEQPHLAPMLAATFSDIDDSGIDFARARQQLPPVRPASPAATGRQKLHELEQLHRQYRTELESNRLLTEATLLAQAAERAAGFPAALGTGKLLVYGFYEMTGVQRELLKQLSPSVELTAFLLTGEGSHDLQQWWQALAPVEESLPHKTETGNLATLREHLFTGDFPVSAPDDTVRVLSCPNEISEAREIAREAIRLRRERGISFPEMAVLARDAAGYLPLLAGVFEQVGLPFYLREGLPLSATASGSSMLTALRLSKAGYRRPDVMQWFTSGAIDPHSLLADGEEAPVSLWDRISADAGIVQGEKQWRECLALQARAFQSDAQAATGSRQAALTYRARQAANLAIAMERIFTFGDHCRQQRRWSALAGAAISFLRRYHTAGSERDRVEEALATLGTLDRLPQPANLTAFVAAAEQKLAGVSLTRGALQQTGIHLLSLAAARHTRFRVVFVPGLTEGSFPAAGRQDPILLDEERRMLSAGQEAALPVKSTRPREERFLFRLAVEAAGEHLVLSVPRANAAAGGEKIVSHFLLQALAGLTGKPVHQGDLQSSAAAPAPVIFVRDSGLLAGEPRTALDDREFDLRTTRAALASKQPARARFVERRLPNLARAIAAEQAQWGSDGLTAYDGLLDSPECRLALAALFSEDHAYSPTALERYAACPYRFFLHDVLRLQELEEPELIDEIDARDKGELMHAILRDFYAEMKDSRQFPLCAEQMDAYLAALAKISQRHFQRVENEGRTGPSATWALKQQFLRQDLERHVRMQADSEWLPEDFERAFGGKDDPTEIPIGGGTIRLRGQIDRIDLSPDRTAVRVVDYKSGQSRYTNKDRLRGGTALQLPLYLLAAASFHRHIDLHRSSAEYCHITRRGGWKTYTFPGTALEEQQEEFSYLLRTIINGCREGIYPRCPEEDNKSRADCKHCEFARVGDPRREKLWQRKQSDPRLVPFLRMREVK